MVARFVQDHGLRVHLAALIVHQPRLIPSFESGTLFCHPRLT